MPSAPLDPSPRLGFHFTARTFVPDDGLARFYDTISCLGLVYSRMLLPGTRMAAAAGYGRRSVDAYRDPTFVQSKSAKLELFPFELGLRFGRVRPRVIEMTAGFALEGVWLRETLPPLYGAPGTGRARHSSFVPGARIALGPDLRLPWRDLVLGGELSLELMAGAHHAVGWYANPTAVSWRITLVRTR